MPGGYLFRSSYPKRDQPHVNSTFFASLSVLVKGEEAPFLTEKEEWCENTQQAEVIEE